MTPGEQIFIDAGQSPVGFSTFSRAIACMKKYGLTYEDRPRIRGVNSRGPANGNVLHNALCHRYAIQGAKQGGVWIPDPANSFRSIMIKDASAILAPEAAMAREAAKPMNQEASLADCLRTYEAYCDKYLDEGNTTRTLVVEGVYTAKLPLRWEPFRCRWKDIDGEFKDQVWDYIPFTTRKDWVFQWRRKTYSADHKTSGYWTKKQQIAYSQHGQFNGQRWVGQALWGVDFGGFLLNGIQVASKYTRQRDGVEVDQPPKFERPSLAPRPKLLADFPWTLEWYMRGIAELQARGVKPRDYPPAQDELICRNRYSLCEFADDVCAGLA